jgi:hypothetical protein
LVVLCETNILNLISQRLDTICQIKPKRIAVHFSPFLETKAPFGLKELKFNSHHIDVLSNAWSTKCRLIACMSAQIRSNLQDESIKPN